MYKLFLFDEYLGNLYYDYKNNREVFSFEFSDDYLKKHDHIVIDPELGLFSGRQYSEDVFGFVNDLIPDRFGRTLLKERERLNAIKENRIPRKLTTLDYILGTDDMTRMGAIRVQDEDGFFTEIDIRNHIPPYIYLREVEQASLKYEKSGEFLTDEYRRLLLPGSSLGGARPKANIYFEDELYIAKFPSNNDSYDVELWEKIAMDLALICGINAPQTQLEKYSKNGSTLLVKRFDRKDNKRIHYISFMTALNARDGDSGNYSYLDMASYIKSSSTKVKEDLNELYKRMVFSYLINNTDNHLRNHGLLYDGNDLILSPIFDVNPSFEENAFALSLTHDGKNTKDSIINESKYYEIEREDAIEMYSTMVSLIEVNLDLLTKKYGARSREKELLKLIINSRA